MPDPHAPKSNGHSNGSPRPETVVITGASAGVGHAVVREFAKRGARIGLLARGVDGLNAAKHEVERLGGQALVLPTDVSDADAVEREPYMAPGLVTPEKVARGKMPTDVIWHTIVSPTGREKTGYPTQKPMGLVRRFVDASSRPGGWCLDFFAGSGTLGAVAAKLDRKFVCVDQNQPAIDVMAKRLAPHAAFTVFPAT